MPKEVEAVFLETIALKCSCTLNVHERDGDRLFQKKQKQMFFEETKRLDFLHRKIKECSDCGRNSSSSNWSYTLKH